MLLVDLNYNFECDWFVELFDNKLSDNNLASELVGNRSFFKPITIEEIVIFMIIIIIALNVNEYKRCKFCTISPTITRKSQISTSNDEKQ